MLFNCEFPFHLFSSTNFNFILIRPQVLIQRGHVLTWAAGLWVRTGGGTLTGEDPRYQVVLGKPHACFVQAAGAV